MKFNIIFVALSILFPVYSWADIPEKIEYILTKNIEQLKNRKITGLNEKERGFVKDNIINLAMHNFQEEIPPRDPEDLRKEIVEFVEKNTAFWKNQLPAKSALSFPDLVPVINLIAAFNGQKSGNMLRLIYRGVNVPLSLSFNNDTKKLSLILEGPSTTDKTNDCIVLSHDLRNNDAYLHYLSSQSACPIPSENRNSSFLVNLASDIAKTLGARKLELEDASGMLCVRNQKSSNFRILRAFQHKKGLYENFGFSPLVDYVGDIRKEIDFIKSIKITDILSTIESVDFWEELTQDEQNTLQIFKETLNKFKADKDYINNLGDYMAWLWGYNCAEYGKIFKIFFKTKFFWESTPFKKPIWPKYNKWFPRTSPL